MTKPRARRLIAWCLLGMLLGASGAQLMANHERSQLLAEREHWHREANHWRQEWVHLQEEISRANRRAEKRLVVQSLTVFVLDSPVPSEAVREALDPLTSILLGMPLAGAQTQVLYAMFNRRVLRIGARWFRVEVVALLLAAESQLLVRVIKVAHQAVPS